MRGALDVDFRGGRGRGATPCGIAHRRCGGAAAAMLAARRCLGRMRVVAMRRFGHLAAGGVAIGALAAAMAARSAPAGMLGFAPASAEAERGLEARFDAGLS